MPGRSDENLRAEYLLIQSQYEAFDGRALSLKALATPLLGVGIAAGIKDDSRAILGDRSDRIVVMAAGSDLEELSILPV